MTIKHILLMYISEISGHHSATLAIEKAIKILQPDTVLLNINAFHYTNPVSEKIVNRIYLGVIKRTPKLWDYLYDNPSVVKNIERLKETIHKLNSPKLKELFDEFKPDAIVCTQAFPCGMVADFKKTYNSHLPLIAVLTDYIPHSYWIYDRVNYYISPSDEVTERLLKKGVEPEKIKTLGIPFDPKFNREVRKFEVRARLKLKPFLPTLLIMGGGQGLGPMKTIVKALEKVKLELQEIIVVGSNQKLYNFFKKRLKKYKKRLVVFGYLNNIDELMSVSDIIITKPGGITTAEALAKKIPMVIVKPIPGQETNNARYLTEKGVAIKLDRAQDIKFIIEDLLRNPAKLNHMRQCSSRISKPNAALDIAKLLLDL